ncbi:MAG: hypothetical protein H6540_08180, partial [Bacteroidales bacterium]|nr:hypothetical protein [Bacteroidales bacterium]
MRKILLLAFLSNIIFASVFAQQIRSFTSDSAVYLQELDKFTDNYISSEESKTLDAFKLLWSSPTLSPEDRNEIVVFSNFLLKKNGRPSPHFIKYFSSLLLFYSGNYEKMNFNDWRKSLRFYLENKSSSLKVTEQFLDLTLTLLESNTLYNNSATIWRVPQSNFTFEFGKESPLIRFSNVDLICNSKRDSIFIANTSGVLNPEDLSWTGKKGLVTWERAGYNATDVYAELSNYSLSLRKTEYKADSVQFYYKKYFNSPLLGKIEEKVMLINKPENALYPKFYSYQNKYILPGLFKGIEFTGGLSMQGAKLNGTGNEYEPAELDIYYRDTLKMRIQTTQLLITGTGMRSGSVSMSLYLENDSIFHPDLQFNFIENGDEFRFNKSQDYTSEGPYKNSYHKMDMNFEEFLWKRNSGVILFKPNTGTAIGQATFESNGFFNAEFFDKIQGMDNIHPLVGLWQYGRGIGLNKFPASNYANYLGIDNYQVRQQLMKLSRLGFIFFDDASDMVILNDKINYFLDASIGKTDYDVIYFTSRTNAPLENASLNLENNDLTINGIERIFLSDSQNVVLIPDKNQIIMKRNRNFQFNGSIRAGLFTYYGSNFFFDYEGFKINLQNIDSLSLRVKTGEKDNYGQNIVKGISNLIEQVTGEIQIDDPSNKSGLRDFPQYPIFTSRENAFVYFNEPTIQKGVYGKKDMYFEVYPFTIDSLDNFSREGMLLPGKFVSGGILPPLEQTLSLRDDYSLGFFYKAPKEGIPIYEAKGTFYNDMEMSNRGLHGSGQLDYLTSTTYSDDFLFHPDSVMTVSREFLVRKQIAPVEFPKVNSSNNKITWYTKKDQFYASKTDKDFTLFSDTVRLGGDLLLQPSGLSGKGRMDLVDATIASAQFKYKSEKILSDSSDFRLRGPGLEKPAMNMDNVNLAVDFTSRTAQIKSNEDYTLVEFQENRYISMLDFFNWDMKTKEIEMGLSKNLNSKIFADSLSGARYISLNPAQDSLSFVSGKSVFDYKNVIIKALDVPYIQIADARIYPSEGRLNVEKNAKIQRLLKADIIADYTNKYYPLYDSKVDILARNDYKASASYDYIDENQKKWK